MSEEVSPGELRERRTRRNIIILNTILLALIAIATAWSAYQAASWGGRAIQNYARANATSEESMKSSLIANQLTLLDIQIFIQWLNAREGGNTSLAEFYMTRMRAEAKPAFNAWLAQDPFNNPDAAPSPFVLPEYRLQEKSNADQLANQAKDLEAQAIDAAGVSSQYVLTTLIWGLALFFTGLSNSFPMLKFEIAFTSIALALFFYGVSRLVILWIANGG